ncbi:MAG: hypothetical protein C5B59_13695 [Bacteroidetes bacterium]|nr:MAG: hypothetical protein C5B59_13695 [Bacteroidota bacterium]
MLSGLTGILKSNDAATQSFMARVVVVTLAAAFLAVVGCEITLAIAGKEIPSQINALLFAISGGYLFGAGSHSANIANNTHALGGTSQQ